MEFQVFLFFVIFLLVIGLIIHGYHAAKKRREEMQMLASRLGLSYSSEKDRRFASAYGFIGKLAQGNNRYAFNIMRGNHQGHYVEVFDYHYETESTDSKGDRTTHHHYLSCFLLELPMNVPELTISREGMFSKIAQAFGYADIDFESAEFSKAFCVRSADKRFAYDICHAQMMEYLLANRDLSLEYERRTLAMVFGGQLSIPRIEYNLARLVEIRQFFPEYLLENA